MRTSTPRLPPLHDDELDAEQAAIMDKLRSSGPVFGITRTFLRHPRMLQAYQVIARHTFSPDNTLSRRECEIVIMRTVWRAKSAYQWSRHISIGTRAGLSPTEIAALKAPLNGRDWSEGDAALIAAVDDLMVDHHISDEVWAQLSAHFDTRQCIDAVMLSGRYAMTAMFLNSAGTPLDPDVERDPDFEAR